MKKIILSAMVLLLSFPLSAQQLYIPRNIQQAYQNGTRDVSGVPGRNYWQNQGVYNIQETINPENKTISGSETIQYSNNSPNELKMIALRFNPNNHKPQSPRGSYVSKDWLDEGLIIKSLTINGVEYKTDSDFGTVTGIRLKTPIAPKSQATLKIEWEYPLSKQSGREGQIDATTFYAAYSYPRVSVYDDYYGWDMVPHTGRQEFYNDFNDYQVAITAPKNYVVWATGDLLNPQEVLQTGALNRYEQSLKGDQTIHVATASDMKNGTVTLQNDANTWKFKADDITDFCWGTSNHYVWDAGSVQLPGKRVSTQAAYNDGAKDFEQYVQWMRFNLDWFTHNWPGVEYPFPKMTAFQGFADMEYPMMINDSSVPDNMEFARLVADHEIAHTYFPFYMGTNETRYAFMDEGWATTFEYLIGIAENGQEKADQFYKNFRVKRYINDPTAEEDMPIITMSTQEVGMAYGSNSYGKASLAYLAVKDLLGDALFKKALHHYMDNWHGKHPIPWDFFYSMNTGAGQNLNWFWNNWFFSNNYIDLKADSAKQEKGKLAVKVSNVGGFAIPFDAVVTYTDGSKTTKHYTPAVWQANEKNTTLSIPVNKKVKSIDLDGGLWMDYTPDNNKLNL